MRQAVKSGMGAQGVVVANNSERMKSRLGSIYNFECMDKFGNIRWTEKAHNLVVNSGLNHALSIITATAHVTNWYVGLYATGYTPAATDTATTHGFTIITSFSEATLPSFSAGAIAAQSVDNATNVAAFSINAATTIGGAYMLNSNVKATPSEGAILFGVANLGADRAVQNGDTLNVTITVGAEAT